MNQITIETLQKNLKNTENYEFIDVRNEDEFKHCSIEGFKNIPLAKLNHAIENLDPSRQWVVSCKSGFRSQQAYQILAAHHQKLLNVEGGIDAWQNAGLPVIKKEGHGISIMRQVQMIVGVGTLSGVFLSQSYHPNFIWLAAFFGAGMLFAGLSNTCALGALLSKAPWNQA